MSTTSVEERPLVVASDSFFSADTVISVLFEQETSHEKLPLPSKKEKLSRAFAAGKRSLMKRGFDETVATLAAPFAWSSAAGLDTEPECVGHWSQYEDVPDEILEQLRGLTLAHPLVVQYQGRRCMIGCIYPIMESPLGSLYLEGQTIPYDTEEFLELTLVPAEEFGL